MTPMLYGVGDLVTPAVISRASIDTGQSEEAVEQALQLAIPALLMSFAGRCEDSHFVRRLASMAADTRGNMISAPEEDDTAERSQAPSGRPTRTTVEQWLASECGEALSGIVQAIERRAAIPHSSALPMLSTAATLVLAYIGSALRSGAFDATTLTARLRYERGTFAAAAEQTLEPVST